MCYVGHKSAKSERARGKADGQVCGLHILAAIFAVAKKHNPAVILIDECDKILAMGTGESTRKLEMV